MRLRQITILMKVSLWGVAISSAALLCVPMCSSMAGITGRVCSILVACAFWGGLILEQVFFWLANKERKELQKKANKARKLKQDTIGLLAFATSKEARICDVALVVSLLLLIVVLILDVRSDWAVVLVVSMLYASFNLHCILNGKNYRVIKAINMAKIRAESSK